VSIDALSEALSTVRLTGAIFFNAEFTAPWGFAAPDPARARRIMPLLAPGAEHVVVYHLLTEGRAVARTAGLDDLPLAAGDIVIAPHGAYHTVSNGSPAKFADSAAASLGKYLDGDLSTTCYGGGGEATRFVCGFFGCEQRAQKLFLAGLPPLLKINIRGDAAGAWLESSIRHLVCEASSGRPGATVLLSKMAEALFIEALRRYMERLPPEQTGWLAGARDRVVGTALAALHRKPDRRWTVEALAAEAGASRSVLAERFNRFLGEPPLTYLAHWRLQLAAVLLRTTPKTVLNVAADVGYESEAAFNRAFKREFGLPPAQFRRSGREVDGERFPRPEPRALAVEPAAGRLQ
jgi:AraC-like DNA-binding protein